MRAQIAFIIELRGQSVVTWIHLATRGNVNSFVIISVKCNFTDDQCCSSMTHVRTNANKCRILSVICLRLARAPRASPIIAQNESDMEKEEGLGASFSPDWDELLFLFAARQMISLLRRGAKRERQKRGNEDKRW